MRGTVFGASHSRRIESVCAECLRPMFVDAFVLPHLPEITRTFA